MSAATVTAFLLPRGLRRRRLFDRSRSCSSGGPSRIRWSLFTPVRQSLLSDMNFDGGSLGKIVKRFDNISQASRNIGYFG